VARRNNEKGRAGPECVSSLGTRQATGFRSAWKRSCVGWKMVGLIPAGCRIAIFTLGQSLDVHAIAGSRRARPGE
jgi:hypothetical protein